MTCLVGSVVCIPTLVYWYTNHLAHLWGSWSNTLTKQPTPVAHETETGYLATLLASHTRRNHTATQWVFFRLALMILIHFHGQSCWEGRLQLFRGEREATYEPTEVTLLLCFVQSQVFLTNTSITLMRLKGKKTQPCTQAKLPSNRTSNHCSTTKTTD